MVTILIADDDDLILEFLRRKLAGQLFRVLTAPDGETALELARAELPDVIVLDVMMPKRDGFSVLQELKADPATTAIPVIMLTARKTQDDVIQGLEQGVADYLMKPFMPSEFLARVEKVLKKAQTDKDVAWV
jgi:DNA-binding response OmpR family regulator